MNGFTLAIFHQLYHTQKQNEYDSAPRIMLKNNHNEIVMPVSVNVHYALVDGFHGAQNFETSQ